MDRPDTPSRPPDYHYDDDIDHDIRTGNAAAVRLLTSMEDPLADSRSYVLQLSPPFAPPPLSVSNVQAAATRDDVAQRKREHPDAAAAVPEQPSGARPDEPGAGATEAVEAKACAGQEISDSQVAEEAEAEAEGGNPEHLCREPARHTRGRSPRRVAFVKKSSSEPLTPWRTEAFRRRRRQQGHILTCTEADTPDGRTSHPSHPISLDPRSP